MYLKNRITRMTFKFQGVLSLALTCMALASCNNELENTQVTPTDAKPLEGVVGQVTDLVYDDATRTTLTVGNDGVSFAWAEGDEVGIVPEDVSSSQMLWTVKELSEDLHSATFQNASYALSPDFRFVAYYPYKRGAEYRYNEKLAVDYTGQVQPVNNTTAHLGAYDYMYAPVVTANSSGKAEFNFSHTGAMLYINVKSPGVGITVNKLTLRATDALFNVKGEIALSTGEFSPTETSPTMELALGDGKGITLMPDGELTAALMIAPVNLAGKTITVEVSNDKGVVLATKALAGKTYRAGKAYHLAVGETLTGKEVVIENGHAAVDLGLTSGTKWATMNIGATAAIGGAQAIGDFFAWGETEPYYSSISWNADLNSPTIKWRSDKDASVGYYYGNYFDYKGGTTTSNDAYITFGTADNKLHSMRASAEHNAVNKLWGGQWQLAKPAQFQELVDEASWQLFYNNGKFVEGVGISGWLVTGKNGLSIYMPLSGNLYKTDPFVIVSGTTYTTGKRVAYWTSEIVDSPQRVAVFYTQYNQSRTVTNDAGFGRAAGGVYRAVIDKK